MKIIDAKITQINGELHISWQTEDNNWQAAQKFDVADEIVQDPIALKAWCQNYKDAYNRGKDEEAAAIAIPSVPAPVVALINEPLNLD